MIKLPCRGPKAVALEKLSWLEMDLSGPLEKAMLTLILIGLVIIMIVIELLMRIVMVVIVTIVIV